MHRFFGKAKDKQPRATMDEVGQGLEKRTGEVDQKVARLDKELANYKKQLAKAKTPGAKRMIKQKAMRVLKQKKMYEKQSEQLSNQAFNVDQTRFAQQNLEDNAKMVEAMKDTSKQLKKQYKKIDIDEVADLHDDMSDLLLDAEEINEVLGQSYGVPDELDEDDLMDELDALDDELEMEETDQVPDYLAEASTPVVEDEVKTDTATPETDTQVDEFGLPKLTQNA